MKSENYEDLINKFYAGTASAEEILFLKNEGILDEQDELYARTIDSDREAQMEWSFEEFLNEVPKAKLVTFKNKTNWMKKALAIAAVAIALLTVYFLLPQTKETLPGKISYVPVQKVDSNAAVAKNILPVKESKDSTFRNQKILAATQPVRVLPKKKMEPVTDKEINKQTTKDVLQAQPEFDEYLVMVNGKPIYNEAEAVAITRESLSMVSQNLTSTMDEMKSISSLKIKLY